MVERALGKDKSMTSLIDPCYRYCRAEKVSPSLPPSYHPPRLYYLCSIYHQYIYMPPLRLSMSRRFKVNSVAIIGAGPSGLATAK